MVDLAAGTGRVLAHKYRLETRLGEGGFGTIWRAHHLVLEAPVALKLIDPDIATDDAARERFLREAKAAASLRSPHVVQILDYGVDDLQPFIAMELLEGENLAQRIKRLGPLGSAAPVGILPPVAGAAAPPHEAGIVHRDLKPDNVFLVKNDDDEVAKVLDFGLAKVEPTRLGPPGHQGHQGSMTRTGSLLGTPFYMSPEQAQGNKEVDFRSDLWSLGVIAFEMMTGRRPFSSDGLGDLVLQICIRPLPVPSDFAVVPQSFDQWFARACAHAPEARFQSARELADTLREALEVDPDAVSNTPDDVLPARFAPLLEGSGEDQEPDIHTARTAVDERAQPSPADPLTVQQFGTTFSEGEEKPRGRGLVVLVAMGALLLGLGAGVVTLKMRPPAAPMLDSPSLSPAEAPLRTADPARERWLVAPPPLPSSLAPAPSTSTGADAATEPHGGAPSAKALDPSLAMDSARRTANDAGPPASWLPARGVDGGWVKPEWARPDPEPLHGEDPAETENPY